MEMALPISCPMGKNVVMDGSVKDWMLRVVRGRVPEVAEHGPPPELHPDLIALNATLERIRAEEPQPLIILAHHLRVLTRRGVRITSINPAPAHLSGRLRFADGSTVLVHADRVGVLSDLAVRLAGGQWVRLTETIIIGTEVRLRLTTANGSLLLVATGFDQAD